MFRNTDLHELYDAAYEISLTEPTANKAEAALNDYLKEIGRLVNPEIKVVFNNQEHNLSDYKNEDGTYTIQFDLTDKSAIGFDFKVTTGSTISYVITELDNLGADRTDIHYVDTEDGNGTEFVNKLFAKGTMEITTGSFVGYTICGIDAGSSLRTGGNQKKIELNMVCALQGNG